MHSSTIKSGHGILIYLAWQGLKLKRLGWTEMMVAVLTLVMLNK